MFWMIVYIFNLLDAGYFSCFCRLLTFSKLAFSQSSFRNTQSVNRFGFRSGPTESRHSVGPDVGPNYLQRLSVDTSKERVNTMRNTYTVKPVLSSHSKRTQKMVFNTDYCLMQVKSIAECSPWSILQYFWPSLSYHFSIKMFVFSIIKWPLAIDFTVCVCTSIML